MFCPYCGKEIAEKATICVGCGRSVKSINHPAQRDSSSVGWWWLGFFFPLLGFILWCVWTGNTPIKAKRVGWGSLIGVIVSVASVVLFYAALIFLAIAESAFYF